MGDLLQKLQQSNLESHDLPFDLVISTATITCKIDVMFNVKNIAHYFNDFDNIIIGKRYGNRIINNIINVKKIKTNKKKKKKEKKNFYNQVSLIFRSASLMGLDPDLLSIKEKFKSINVKLFINGSIQMTGCKHLGNIKKCLEILFEKLKLTKAIYSKDLKSFEKKEFVDSIENLNLEKIKLVIQKNSLNSVDVQKKKNIKIKYNDFVQKNAKKNSNNNHTSDEELSDSDESTQSSDSDLNLDSDLEFDPNEIIIDKNKSSNNPINKFDKITLSIDNVHSFKIRMINTNFNIGFQINRSKLQKLLTENGIDATFDPITHPYVNISYNISEISKNVSIFVFESGSITIAGSNTCYQILVTYEFINKFILSNYSTLLSKPITPQILLNLIKNMEN